MTITFWGVRGTVVTPGPHTVRYGGNTACVSVEIGEHVLVLDAGSGIRALGEVLAAEAPREIFVLLSHLHNDHITGFPFFRPLYERGRTIHLVDYPHHSGGWSLLNLLDGVHFPLLPRHLYCEVTRIEHEGLDVLRRYGLAVTACPLNHPGGALGYRVEHDGRAFVFIPDNELEAANPVTSFEELAAFCRGADVLCHDAQYLGDELDFRLGWGHSRVRRVRDLARAAAVRHLVLFHHDPTRTDDALDEVQAVSREDLAGAGIACTAAYEGLQLTL